MYQPRRPPNYATPIILVTVFLIALLFVVIYYEGSKAKLEDASKAKDKEFPPHQSQSSVATIAPPIPEKPKEKPASEKLGKNQSPQPQPLTEPPEPSKPLTVNNVIASIREEIPKLLKEFEAEYPQQSRLLTPDELEVAEFYLKRTDNYSLAFRSVNNKVLKKWIVAKSYECALGANFKQIATYVWNRSPKMRTQEAIFDLAYKWGYMDHVSRQTHLGIINVIEGKEPPRELLKDERDFIVKFAGEEYYINRP